MREPGPAYEFLMSRKSTALLKGPGPNEEELNKIIQIACTAPDHGRLYPFRFVAVQGEQQQVLGEVFAATVRREQPDASEFLVEKARAKALAAPLQVYVFCVKREGKIPHWEQQAAAACSAFGIALGAHALGYGAIWKSFGMAIGREFIEFFNIKPHETLMGWVNLGTSLKADGKLRAPVPLDDKLSLMGHFK